MDDRLPLPARILGPAGLIPFAGLAGVAALSETLGGTAAFALMAYGVAIASFLGAVHWGLALRPAPGEERAAWGRFGLGVVPALLAWAVLLATVAGVVSLVEALAALAALLVGTAAVESWAAGRGLVPRGYLRLRWGLSLGAAACLAVAAAAG